MYIYCTKSTKGEHTVFGGSSKEHFVDNKTLKDFQGARPCCIMTAYFIDGED